MLLAELTSPYYTKRYVTLKKDTKNSAENLSFKKSENFTPPEKDNSMKQTKDLIKKSILGAATVTFLWLYHKAQKNKMQELKTMIQELQEQLVKNKH